MIKHILTWTVTAVALYIAFQSVSLSDFLDHLVTAQVEWILLAFGCTILSYLLRTLRWRYLLMGNTTPLPSLYRVLILGFFMNNVLPARTGELVRAHLGAKVTHLKRTVVLASIASERLVDGLMLSLFFVLSSTQLEDESLRQNLRYVSALFAAVAIGVGLLLIFRRSLYSLIELISRKYPRKGVQYVADRAMLFIEGLSPLTSPRFLPSIVALSVIIWSIELVVFTSAGLAFGVSLDLSEASLFMVGVNFASLIPLAPGGIGVIEVVGSRLLSLLGIERDLALVMVVTQHVTQMLVVGIPGALFMSTWRRHQKEMEEGDTSDGLPREGPLAS